MASLSPASFSRYSLFPSSKSRSSSDGPFRILNCNLIYKYPHHGHSITVCSHTRKACPSIIKRRWLSEEAKVVSSQAVSSKCLWQFLLTAQIIWFEKELSDQGASVLFWGNGAGEPIFLVHSAGECLPAERYNFIVRVGCSIIYNQVFRLPAAKGYNIPPGGGSPQFSVWRGIGLILSTNVDFPIRLSIQLLIDRLASPCDLSLVNWSAALS